MTVDHSSPSTIIDPLHPPTHTTPGKFTNDSHLSGLRPRLVHARPMSAQFLLVRAGTIIVRLATPDPIEIRRTATPVGKY